MSPRHRRLRSSAIAAAAVLFSCSSGCTRPPALPPATITILTGGTGGSFYPLGAALAEIYSGRIAGLRAVAQSTVASVFNVQAIENGKADMAFTQGDVAYFAYRRGTEENPHPHTKLRGIAVLWANTVQLVVPRNSGIHTVSDLVGRRVAVGSPASGTQMVARIVIEGHGLSYSAVRSEQLSFSEAVGRMQQETLDAAFVVASYPVSAVTEMNTAFGVRLVPVGRTSATRIQMDYPFIKPITIPAKTYAGQDADLPTLGVDNILVCREDLAEDLVYHLTRVLFDSIGPLSSSDAGARLIDPEDGPATPIPLHPGAARFFREREILR